MNKEKQEKLTQFLKENPELQKKLNNLVKKVHFVNAEFKF